MKNVKMWLEDEEGNLVTDGSPGELVIYGQNIMRGYWNDPVATSQRLRFSKVVNDRALYAGDLFRQDEEGFFYFVARMDDVIKSRGEKVSPIEVEDVIYLLDPVHEVRVIGAPDPIVGQAVKAEIVLKEGRTLTEREVKAYCQQHLEDYKVPKIVAFVASLPKTAGGKIKRGGAGS
jgi:acyl-coenzyme A synthetase/AMP-(fatty) acid ligase